VVSIEAHDAAGIVGVQIFLEDQLVAERDVAPYDLEFSTLPFTEGEHSLRAVAKTADGRTGEATQEVILDNTAPSIYQGTWPSETPADFVFEVGDNLGVASVEIRTDGGVIEQLVGPPYTFHVDAGCWNETMFADAIDLAGWVTTIELSVSLVDSCDRDCDSYLAASCGAGDCDDLNSTVFPGAGDGDLDGLDQNCDGVDGIDADGDGVASTATGGNDCNDSVAGVYGPHVESTDIATLPLMARNVGLAVGDGDVIVGYTVDPSSETGGGVYVVRRSTGWTPEQVADDGPSFPRPAYAIGADGTTYVLLADPTRAAARLLSDRTGIWAEEFADISLPVAGRGMSLAIDTAGAVHATYSLFHDDANGNEGYFLQYLTNETGAWMSVELEEMAGTDEAFLAAAGDGSISLGYKRDFPSNLVVGRRPAGGPWAWDILPSSVGGAGASFCLGGDGTPHFSYVPHTTAPNTLVHAWRDAGGWNTEDAASNVGWYYNLITCRSSSAAFDLFFSRPDASRSYHASTLFAPPRTNSVLTDRPEAALSDATDSIWFVAHRHWPNFVRVGHMVSFIGASDSIGDGVDQDCDGSDG
jgi:hypothetical protein